MAAESGLPSGKTYKSLSLQKSACQYMELLMFVCNCSHTDILWKIFTNWNLVHTSIYESSSKFKSLRQILFILDALSLPPILTGNRLAN